MIDVGRFKIEFIITKTISMFENHLMMRHCEERSNLLLSRIINAKDCFVPRNDDSTLFPVKREFAKLQALIKSIN